MICASRGPGVWPLRLAKRQRWGEDDRSPGLKLIVGKRRDKFKRPVQPIELGVVNIRLLRGRSVTHTSERAMWVCAPPEGEKQKELRPRTDRARIAVEVVCPM